MAVMHRVMAFRDIAQRVWGIARKPRRIYLYKWIERGEYPPKCHWIAHYDIRPDRFLTVMFPFNFIVSFYYVCQRVKWDIEWWMLKLERRGELSGD